MIVAYKNYRRTERLELCMRSARHFAPAAEMHCLFLFDDSPEEYGDEVGKIESLGARVHFEKNKYRLGPGCFSRANGFYYTEYLNYFSRIFAGAKKVVAMDEDVYFTTGQTLRWMADTDFDLAWASWHCCDGWGVNASILGINFERLAGLFPIPERMEYIETLLQSELHDRAASDGADLKEIPTRKNHDYCGDGSWTNDTDKIRRDLVEAGVIGGG